MWFQFRYDLQVNKDPLRGEIYGRCYCSRKKDTPEGDSFDRPGLRASPLEGRRLVVAEGAVFFVNTSLFSRDEATLYEGVSVGRSVRPCVTCFFFRPTRSDLCLVYGLVLRGIPIVQLAISRYRWCRD